MSDHTYVGVTPRFLSTGRPVTFGTVLTEDELALADEATRAAVVPPVAADASTRIPAEVAPPAPLEATSSVDTTVVEAPLPQEVVTTGNTPATPELEA